MKKIITFLLVAILATTSICGVYAATNTKTAKATRGESGEFSEYLDYQEPSSEIYEVVKFKAPDKTVYTLEDVYNFPLQGEGVKEGDYIQQIQFEGEGTSMTVRNKLTGETETFEYESCFIQFDDHKMKADKNISFEFTPEINTVLTPGEYTATACVVTSDDEWVTHPFTFTLTDEK